MTLFLKKNSIVLPASLAKVGKYFEQASEKDMSAVASWPVIPFLTNRDGQENFIMQSNRIGYVW